MAKQLALLLFAPLLSDKEDGRLEDDLGEVLTHEPAHEHGQRAGARDGSQTVRQRQRRCHTHGALMGLMCLLRARAHFNLDTNLGAHYEADDLETGRTIARPTDRRR